MKNIFNFLLFFVCFYAFAETAEISNARLDISNPIWVRYVSETTNINNFGSQQALPMFILEEVKWPSCDLSYLNAVPATIVDATPLDGNMVYSISSGISSKSISYELSVEYTGYKKTIRHFKAATIGSGTQYLMLISSKEEIYSSSGWSVTESLTVGPTRSFQSVPQYVGEGTTQEIQPNGTVLLTSVKIVNATLKVSAIQKVPGSVLKLMIYGQQVDILNSGKRVLLVNTTVPWNGGTFNVTFPSTCLFKGLTYHFFECYKIPPQYLE